MQIHAIGSRRGLHARGTGTGIGLLVAVLAAAGASSGSEGAVVEFRMVERTGQTTASPSDGVLNFVAQVRVNTTGSLTGYYGSSFSIVIPGEAESRGALGRDRISNPDGTYYSGISGPLGSPLAGVAAQYGFLVGLNASFNGVINSSVASWTQTSSQDIGLIATASQNQNLLNTPGVDTDADGNPDTAVGTTAILPAQIMRDYFGAGGTWIDLYRFQYAVSDFTPRTLNLVFGGGDSAQTLNVARVFTQVGQSNGQWRPDTSIIQVSDIQMTGITINVVPAPSIAASVLPPAALLLVRRRR